MLTVITPTGARPEAFAACVEQMRVQDYRGQVCWVIVDDGPVAMPAVHIPGWQILKVRPQPFWEPGQNTLDRNILAGLPYCIGKTVVVEDDDSYEPWWLRVCSERLDLHELIGESHSLYRNMATGNERDMGNDTHASLCSTALKGYALEALRNSAKECPRGIDHRLWKNFTGTKKLYRPEPRGVVGLKCWPGRPGIGIGHRL